MKIRTISLHQPWATAVALGLKRVETRAWPTNYRGLLAIHAAKRATPDVQQAFNRAVGKFGYGLNFCQAGYTDFEDLPLGSVVAIAKLVDCLPMHSMHIAMLGEAEKQWGNYQPGRFAWFLQEVHRLPTPIPCVGRQSFFSWEVPPALHEVPALRNLLGPF